MTERASILNMDKLKSIKAIHALAMIGLVVIPALYA